MKIKKSKSVLISDDTHDKLKKHCDVNNLKIGPYVENVINKDIEKTEVKN
jgi:hypothetical protein